MLTNIIEKADLKDKVKPKSITDFQVRNIDQITSNNTIPIGIINADALFLTQQQLDDNTKAKSRSQVVDGKSYENIEVIVAGLMQGEIYQGNVSFQISPKLIQENINNPIFNLEIDFQDGKGYNKYDFKEQLIPFQFKTIGEVSIAIKLNTKRGTYLTYNVLKINQLERPIPYSDKKVVTATKVIQDTNKGARVADNVVGAEYAIYTGCDGVFDRPIIIAEGFDAGQDVNIDVLVAKYYPTLYAFRNNGYDLVFVNYNDGRDYIQNNAQVLKRVIRDVNNRKTGNNKLVVIGESMSGLVARWALKEMENQGETHQVSHFVAFDSPMKGANVSPGFAKLRRFATNAYFPWSLAFDNLNILFNFCPVLKASETPAARQLLLYSNEAGPHPDYFTLQNDLNTLGYPSQAGIRNVAMINGALNGSFQNRPNLGDKMLEVIYFYVVANISANVWSNQVNQSTKVFEGFSWILLPLPGFPEYERTSVTIPKNLDRVSGGNISFNAGIPTNFSFANTFSTIDYRGALNSDADYTIPIFDVFNQNSVVALTDAHFRVKPDKQNLTPFNAIYGNYTGNTSHAVPRDIQTSWNDFVREEFDLNPTGVLNGCAPPIPPVATRVLLIQRCPDWQGEPGCLYLYDRPLPNTICKPEKLILRIKPDPNANVPVGTYNVFIRIVGNGVDFTIPNNGQLLETNTLPVGTYTVSSIIRYNGNTTNIVESVSSGTLTISGNCRVNFECPSEQSQVGDIVMWLNDINMPVFRVLKNNTWITVTENGTFIPRSRLISNGLDVTEANCYAETDPSGGLPACQCGFTLITANQNAGQYSGSYTFNSCNASTQDWQLLNGNAVLANGTTSPVTASTVSFNIPSTVNSGNYQLKVDATTNCSGTGTQPFSYTKPSGTIDCNFTVSASANLSSVGCGGTSQLTATCSGSGCSGVSYAWNGNGSNYSGSPVNVTLPNSNGTVGYTLIASKSGCSTQTTNTSISVSGCSNGGSCNYTEGQYLTTWFGDEVINAYICGSKFYAKNNSGDFKSKSWLIGTGRFTTAETNCFEESDPRPAGCSGGGCMSPTPTLSASSSTVPSTLTASGCAGTVYWSTGASGNSISVSTAGTYTATCTNPPCTISGNGSVTVTNSGGGCSYTNGQFLTEWFGNEVVRAYICGTKFYAKNDAGYFKSRSWLVGTGRFTTAETDCFEEVNPGCGGLRVAAVQSEETDNNIAIYPNPTTGKIKIVFSLQKSENVWLNLYDVQGKSLDLRDFEGKTGRNEMEYDLQSYPSGAYFVNFQSSEKREVLKITKVN